MFSLVLSALRARRAQTAALFALTVLAALGASAAPWFVGWAADSVAVADISAAPTMERIVRATGVIRYDEGAASPAKVMRDAVDSALSIPGSTSVVAERLFATARPPGTSADSPQASLYIGYRENICPQLRIEGACPDGQGDVMIGRTTAESLKLKVGDELRFEAFRLPEPPTLRISGIYEVKDILSPYWAGTDMISGPVGVVATKVDESAFTSEPTLLAMGITGLDMEYQITVPPETFRTSTLDLIPALVDAKSALRAQNIDVSSDAGNLVERIRRDRHLATLGVTVATLQLVLLCWFALYLAVRQTAQSRQPDIGLLKLRGSARWRIGTLTALQSAVPMVAGVAVGWLLGYLAAALLSRRLD